MSSNIQRLGETLAGRMKKSAAAAVPTTLELGTINGNMSLTVDSIGTPIPQADYMVDLRLTHETYYSYNELYDADMKATRKPHHHAGGTHGGHDSGNGSHTHDDGLHDHRVPSVFRRLEPGDRVLVAWIGYQPVIVAIVVAGTTITSN